MFLRTLQPLLIKKRKLNLITSISWSSNSPHYNLALFALISHDSRLEGGGELQNWDLIVLRKSVRKGKGTSKHMRKRRSDLCVG